ncbi:MAG TPA: enolase C-terminal domain-like protein [Acidobacteriaceae bacterium]|jgi:L-rhamnonate dehydratase
MKICNVVCHVTPMAGSWLTETVVANPMSIYPEYWERRSSWYRAMSAAVIEVTLEDGTTGCGFVGGGKGHAVASLLEEQMRDLIVGKSVFDTELTQEQLYRASVFYGRGGLAQSAISGIDIALWDAKGKLLGQPVYNLLGGKTREQMMAYYTGNDPAALREFGIRDMKIAMPYGPAHGEAGMRKNEEIVAKARETLGSDGFIALDIYMSWTVPYALAMYERLRDYRIAWLEEPVPPDNYEGYRQLRRSIPIMVTGGEHEYTLEGFRRLIEDGCVDIVQPDIYRAGGPTGLMKIAALAKAHHVQLICHGIGSPTYHFLISNGPELTPFCEYLDIYRGATQDWVLTDDPRPLEGTLRLADSPGFGYRLNEKVFRDQIAVTPIW